MNLPPKRKMYLLLETKMYLPLETKIYLPLERNIYLPKDVLACGERTHMTACGVSNSCLFVDG